MPIARNNPRSRVFALCLTLTFSLSAASAFALQTGSPTDPPQTSPTVPQGLANGGAVKSAAPAPTPKPEQKPAVATPETQPAAVPTKVEPLVISRQPTDPKQPLKTYCGTPQPGSSCRIGDTLVVSFDNLQHWLETSKVNPASIYLVLNGREMKGLTSRGPSMSYSSLEFTLAQTSDPANDNRATWNTLIGELRGNQNLHVSVASGGTPPFPDPVDVPFQVFPAWTWAVVLFLLGLLIGFLLLAVKSDIVRDSPSIAGIKQSYSLARCQMASWFFIVAASYCYIWLTLNNHDSLTDGVLILTGISAATGLAGTVLSSNLGDPAAKQAALQTALQDRIAALPALIEAATDPAVKTALQAELAAKNAALTDLARHGVTSSEGFLFDLLRDETGISFHRFQMAGWTVILGFVFIAAVYSQLAMPNFSATLLGLMGISSGTYVGFKISNLPQKSSS